MPYPAPAGGPFPGYAWPGPPPMPGTAKTVRVLMFVLGGLGLLLAAFMVVAAALPSARAGMVEAMGESGFTPDALAAVVAMVLVVVGGYSVVSVILAAFMKRRSVLVYWSVIAFHAVALAWSLLTLLTGSGTLLTVVPAVLMLGIMSNRVTLAYYRSGAS
ncbi:ascorbate-specific PTS system EIIC-type component UlaA [Spinactinospora alkalitolerans]|uniref:Ascorbate-specific PTS system EIIC-type component UlaA n=1 Tax=Spinactinospora alkalitolerans TaxID=687207 RepID=A0A852U6X5_9ACTN|nr:hypothetical protein [Spinactinospora alkalitolerans]NYE50623.1 ascorbate-specific PTS system EIIC-type component UlaA [Spinactinospora alkalitolerans]